MRILGLADQTAQISSKVVPSERPEFTRQGEWFLRNNTQDELLASVCMCIHVYLKTFPCMHEHSCVSHQTLRNHMAFAPTYVSIWACILACSQGPNRMQPLLCTWAISPHKREAPLSPYSLPPLSPPESASVAPSLPPIRPPHEFCCVVWLSFPSAAKLQPSLNSQNSPLSQIIDHLGLLWGLQTFHTLPYSRHLHSLACPGL